MSIADKLRNQLDALRDFEQNKGRYMAEALDSRRESLLDAQREQLFEGKDSYGQDMRPYYSEDPYFKKPGAADRYKAWKVKTTPSDNRNPEAPNLYIYVPGKSGSGRFHSEIDVYVGPDRIDFFGSTPYAQRIIDKYGRDSFGLSPENWKEFLEREGVMNEIREKLLSLLHGTDTDN